MRNLVYAINMQLLKIQSDYNHFFSLTRKKRGRLFRLLEITFYLYPFVYTQAQSGGYFVYQN